MTLELRASSKGHHSAQHTTRWPHIATEQILTAKSVIITAWAHRTHADAQEPCEAEADIKTMSLDNCELISIRSCAPEFIFGQVDDYLVIRRSMVW